MKQGRSSELFGLILVIIIYGFGLVIIEAVHARDTGALTPVTPGPLLIWPVSLLAVHFLLRFAARDSDQLVLPLCAFLATLGLLALKSLGLSFSEQLLWIELGLAGLAAIAVFLRRPERLGEYKYLAGAAGLLLLLAPIFVGTVRGGSKLWLVFGGHSFQPGEPAKILLTVFLAAYLSEKKELLTAGGRRLFGISWPEPRHFGPLIVTWMVSLAVLIFERDLGSSLIFFTLFLMMLYIATGRPAFIVTGALLFFAGASIAYKSFSHVAARVDVWLAPLPGDVSGSSYQVAQSLFALGAGGTAGSGLGTGLLGRAVSMPAVHTDFIFSALGEELGLAGLGAILLTYLVLIARGFAIGLRSDEGFSTLLAVGLVAVTGVQAMVIIGGVIKAFPLTGVTLPFVSYGGSSIVSSFIMAGLVMAISGRRVGFSS